MYTYDENVCKRIVNITNEHKLSEHCFDFKYQPTILISALLNRFSTYGTM